MTVAHSWDSGQLKYIRKILAHKQIPQIRWQTGIKMNTFPVTEAVTKLTYVLFNIYKIPLVPNLNPN